MGIMSNSETVSQKAESPEQFVVRMLNYLQPRVEFSNTDQTYVGLSDMIVWGQLINACPKDLSVFLRDKGSENLADLTKAAEQFLNAHKRNICQANPSTNRYRGAQSESDNQRGDPRGLRCYKCNGFGHKAIDCPTSEARERISDNTTVAKWDKR